MCYMYVVLTNMVQLLRLKHYNKKRRQNKFVIFIIKYMLKFINGLILDLIILEEQVLNGIRKSVRKYSCQFIIINLLKNNK